MIIPLLFILLKSSSIYGQNKIAGIVVDRDSVPLAGVTVCQDKSENCTMTDSQGAFQLIIENIHANTLKFSFIGYKNVVINSIDTIKQDLAIQMLYDDFTDFEPINYSMNPKLRWGVNFSFQLDMIEKDFNMFSSYFGDDNIEFMNKLDVVKNWELSVSVQRYQAGLIYGWSYSGIYDNDSLDIEFNNSLYGLSMGYKLVDSKHIAFVPKFAVKWYRFRLINNDKDRKISLNQYMTDRDLDVRLNQTIGFIGASLSYKIYKVNYIIPSDYWSVGLYGGYIFKLNDYPWIYSRQNRLMDNNKILLSDFNIGLSISFMID